MSLKAPTPHQWQLIQQLQQAGCPLDVAHLSPPSHPVRVLTIPWRHGALPWKFVDVFPVDTGVGIVLRLRIVASVSTTISGLRLEAAWFQSPFCVVKPCEEHRGSCCFPRMGAHLPFSAELLLNDFSQHPLRLKSGEACEGFLLGTTNGLLSGEPELVATLWVEDIFGADYPYLITMKTVRALGMDRDETARERDKTLLTTVNITAQETGT